MSHRNGSPKDLRSAIGSLQTPRIRISGCSTQVLVVRALDSGTIDGGTADLFEERGVTTGPLPASPARGYSTCGPKWTMHPA